MCDALFAQAHARNMRLFAGKVLTDDPATTPGYLRDRSPAEAKAQCEQLIRDWHHKGRLTYAVTPRFGLSCTEGMLEMAGELYDGGSSGPAMQTHLAENWTEGVENIAKFKSTVPDLTSHVEV